MKEFIGYIVKNLVDKPDGVDIEIIDKDSQMVIKVKASVEDIGKVVGRQGRTIKALRTIALIVGVRIGKKVCVEVVQ